MSASISPRSAVTWLVSAKPSSKLSSEAWRSRSWPRTRSRSSSSWARTDAWRGIGHAPRLPAALRLRAATRRPPRARGGRPGRRGGAVPATPSCRSGWSTGWRGRAAPAPPGCRRRGRACGWRTSGAARGARACSPSPARIARVVDDLPARLTGEPPAPRVEEDRDRPPPAAGAPARGGPDAGSRRAPTRAGRPIGHDPLLAALAEAPARGRRRGRGRPGRARRARRCATRPRRGSRAPPGRAARGGRRPPPRPSSASTSASVSAFGMPWGTRRALQLLGRDRSSANPSSRAKRCSDRTDDEGPGDRGGGVARAALVVDCGRGGRPRRPTTSASVTRSTSRTPRASRNADVAAQVAQVRRHRVRGQPALDHQPGAELRDRLVERRRPARAQRPTAPRCACASSRPMIVLASTISRVGDQRARRRRARPARSASRAPPRSGCCGLRAPRARARR